MAEKTAFFEEYNMKKLLMLSAVFAATLAQPAMANSCHDCDEGSHSHALTARINAETAKAEMAMANAAELTANDAHKAEAGWPCDNAKLATKTAMRAAAEAIAIAAAADRKAAKDHDCVCEDCADGLCTEASHTKVASADCAECVDQASVA